VTLEDSQVVDNYSENVGGGMYIVEGSVILTGTTTFSGNSAFQGGGIFANGGTLEIAETCRVTRNEAFTGTGGGIRRNGSAVTLQGLDPSPIVVENCHENCVGGVPKCAEEPVYCPEP
jgi:predicted outer membrane repeat protein